MNNYKNILLCILDGFGLNPKKEYNAVYMASTPVFDSIFQKFPATTLVTYGTRVGLPDGQMGNSEVGHMNIGAGRVVEQWLVRISRLLDEGYLERSAAMNSFLSALSPHSAVHLVGLYSDGGIHSHLKHSLKVSNFLSTKKIRHYFHLITDGRDTSPDRGLLFAKELESTLSDNPLAKVVSVSGRFYAMDRDKRWERTYKAYDAIYNSRSPYRFKSSSEGIAFFYAKGITDEFIEPSIVGNYKGIEKEDGVLFFNFREDRMRQLVSLFLKGNESAELPPLKPHNPQLVISFTNYDKRLPLNYIFAEEKITSTLGEIICQNDLPQLRISETEKYPHVTYFFNCGREEPFPKEERIHIPSPRDVKTYDEKPEMSAPEVAQEAVKAIKSRRFALTVLNFANPDMVGHTGNLEAAVKAVECVDLCLKDVLSACKESNTAALIFADHGNAEQMIDYESSSPHTAHTTYPVPCILVSEEKGLSLRQNASLCDIAPTALALLGMQVPPLMKGKPLFNTKTSH